MPARDDLTVFLDERLNINRIPGDASNNGLQVQGARNVEKAVFAVDASLALFEEAARADADFIFVHHGVSWGGNLKRLTGPNALRLRPLFQHGVSLYAMHLPLDGHPELGHNALLAKILGLEDTTSFAKYDGVEIGVRGQLPVPLTELEIANKVAAELERLREEKSSRRVKVFDDDLSRVFTQAAPGKGALRKVGVISGGCGCDGLLSAAENSLDCLLTGETGHSMRHLAREAGVAIAALGHYRSEIPGVLAVMAEVAEKFNMACEFIDIPTGM